MSYKLSQKVTLNEGDRIRVSNGPYYLCKSGKKINMGHKGVGTFVGVDSSGDSLLVKFRNESAQSVYIGKEYVSELTGTIYQPHKIVKLRKKK